MADYSITTGPTPSTLNIRTIYDNAIQGFSDGQNAILQYSDVKMEFFVGTARTSYLPYRTNTSYYFPWWGADSGNIAEGFVANMGGATYPQFPCIGRKIANAITDEGNVADGWLAFHPASTSNGDSTKKLSIKITPQNNKTITGYKLYYQDQYVESGSIGIATGQNATEHQYARLYGANTTPPANWSYDGSFNGYAKVFSYTKTLATSVTSNDFLYINIDDAQDNLAADAGTIKMELYTYVPGQNAPTPLTFVNNTLTVANDISSTDTDIVSFLLPAGSIMYSFNVTSLLNANSITYSLDISGGANVSTGTITTTGFSLLGGNNLTPAINTTYILTLTSGSTNTYTIIGKMLGPGYTTIPYKNPVVLYTFDSNGINSGTGGSTYNAIINGTSVIDTTNKFIGTGSVSIAGGSSWTGGVGSEVNSVEIGNGITNLSTSAFTISFWLKMGSGITANPRLFHSFYGSSGQYVLWSNGSGHTSLSLFPPNQSFNPTITTYANNSFHHFVITYSSGVHKIYIDNSSPNTISASLGGNFTRFRLGGALGQGDPTIGPGNIDDFRFYNYAADATFVSYLYKLGSNTNIASLSSVPIDNLIAAGASVSQLVDTGKPINDIINAGYSIDALIKGGVSITTLITSGVSIDTLLANNVTISQMVASGVPFSQLINYAQWLDLSATSNIFNRTYVNNFVDLSGSLLIRNNGALTVGGDVSMSGNLVMSTPATSKLIINDLSLNGRLFIGKDPVQGNGNVSIQGNVNIGGDLAINNQFSGNFADGIIPTNAIIDYPSSGGDVTITGKVQTLGDVSFNGTTLQVGSSSTLKINGNIILSDQTVMNSYDNNISSGTFAQENVIFKDSRFDSVVVLGAATVTGAITTASDYRIKENVEDLDSSFTLDSLTPVEYDNILSGNHEYGVIAHELQATYPFLVQGEKDGPEYQRVSYPGLIGVMVNEVKTLKQNLETLKTRI